MKIKKKTNRKRWVFVTTALVIMLVASVAAYVMTFHNNRGSDSTTTNIDTQQQRDNVKANYEKDKSDIPYNSQIITTSEVPVSRSESITIISASQSNGKVEAVAQTSSEGTCVFQYTIDGDKPVTSQSVTKSKQCSNSVSEVQFSKLGTWKLTVTLYINNNRVETSRDVTIN